MNKIRGFVVVGHPTSDIGKGWVTSSIAGVMGGVRWG